MINSTFAMNWPTGIPRLTNASNYNKWKASITRIFQVKHIFEIINKTETIEFKDEKFTDDTQKLLDEALELIYVTVDSDILDTMDTSGGIKEVW